MSKIIETNPDLLAATKEDENREVLEKFRLGELKRLPEKKDCRRKRKKYLSNLQVDKVDAAEPTVEPAR